MEDAARKAKILIAGDRETTIRPLEHILHPAGYERIESTDDPRRVLPLFGEFHPDLILLNRMLSDPDRPALVTQLASLVPEDAYLPILLLTTEIAAEPPRPARSVGIVDFLTMPFDSPKTLLRVHNLLMIRLLYVELQQRIRGEAVADPTRSMEELVARLAQAAEFREDETGRHTERVGLIASILARYMELPEDQIGWIRWGAALHDVGKISLPSHLLMKPGRLTAEEYEIMKTHTTIGAKVLCSGRWPLLQMAAEIALTHHERWDGTGYPRGLKGEAIPLSGRIVAVADVFNSLLGARSYRKAWTIEESVAEIKRGGGTQFDPRVVERFLQHTPDR